MNSIKDRLDLTGVERLGGCEQHSATFQFEVPLDRTQGFDASEFEAFCNKQKFHPNSHWDDRRRFFKVFHGARMERILEQYAGENQVQIRGVIH